MVMSYAADLTPITECDSLLDLNVCFSYSTYARQSHSCAPTISIGVPFCVVASSRSS